MTQNSTLARQYGTRSISSYLHPVSGVTRGSTHITRRDGSGWQNFLDLKNAGVDMNLYPQ